MAGRDLGGKLSHQASHVITLTITEEGCTSISLSSIIDTLVVAMSLNTFPQELINEIITQLRYCHPRALIAKYDLRNTSLVSKKWVRESQKLLFEETYLSGWKLDLRGRDTPKFAVDIHHLTVWFGDQLTPAPLEVVEDFIPRLKSFKNVRTLTLDMIDTTGLSQPNVAVHFPDSLTSLYLRDSLLEISTFIAIFSSLPALLELHARGVTLTGPEEIPTKPVSESLRVLDVKPIDPFRMIASRDMILPLFAAHPLAYQELRFVGGCTVEHILPLISASTETLERLTLPALTEGTEAPDMFIPSAP